MMDEKTIEGLTEEQWKERYIAFMKKHSDIEDWQADESADAAWLMAEDESPEESAETELSYLS
jgi:hypothetical protein